MPSATALAKMSDTGRSNIVEKAARIPLNGLVITQAFDNVGANGKGNFETSANEALVQSLIADRGITGALAALGAGGHQADAFRVIWDVLDDHYSYYNTVINDAFIDLGIAYADYLKAGGAKLTDIVKYEPDSASDADTIPERMQTLHDNILGNFSEAGIADKFGAGANAIFDRIDDAGYGAFLGTIGDFSDGRPYYGGYDYENATPTMQFDQQFFGL